MSEKIRELTTADFAAAIASGTVLVDFWAPWCGPCRMQAPILEGLADAIAGKGSICKVNIDENMEIAAKFGITSIPTLILFKDGKAAKMLVGLQQANTLQALFQ